MPSSRTRPTRRTCLESSLAIALCASLGALNTACATSRMGDAEVRLLDGQPCFSISAKEAARGPTIRLQAVLISDTSTKPVDRVWSVMLDQQRLPTLSPDSCVAYGQTPEGATSKPTPVPELQSGKVYQVHLNTRSSDSSDPTRGYVGKFCFMPDGANSRRLVPLKPGSREWIDEVCR
ncbi:hypothetical protein [Roseateles noduli]|jgi:hypothetical protein|uniref:hypothetical protein n=1 Tax=Roseateles noduli TaxID=2052484 RepID=UPI003D65692A